MSRSKASSTTSAIRASGRSILLTTISTGRPDSSALRSTKRVYGSGPSLASTRSSAASTMASARSTSPPKSAWPGVSTTLTTTSAPSGCGRTTAVFFARIVMPRSRSRSPESMTRSSTSWLARNAPDCHSMASTRVVLPWSTWAMMATLRRSERTAVVGEVTGAPRWWEGAGEVSKRTRVGWVHGRVQPSHAAEECTGVRRFGTAGARIALAVTVGRLRSKTPGCARARSRCPPSPQGRGLAEEPGHVRAESVPPRAPLGTDPQDRLRVDPAALGELPSAPITPRGADLVVLGGDHLEGELLVAQPREHLLVQRGRSDLTVHEQERAHQRLPRHEVALHTGAPRRALGGGDLGVAVARQIDQGRATRGGE